MKKQIIVDFDKNRVTTVGRVSDRDFNLAIARLRLRQTKPSKRDRIKKAFRCLKKAIILTFRKPHYPIHLQVRAPLAIVCTERDK